MPVIIVDAGSTPVASTREGALDDNQNIQAHLLVWMHPFVMLSDGLFHAPVHGVPGHFCHQFSNL